MTHMYLSARAEGRISYGHLGRTNSCYITKLNRSTSSVYSSTLNSLVSSTIVIFVVLTFDIALVFLNLYANVNCEI